MRVGILGAAEARIDGVPVDLGTRKQRALLAALAMRRGQPVGPDTLVDLLWVDGPPAAVTATLQGYVARLRRALEPDRAPRAPSEVLVTQQAGYALLLPDDALDATRFEAAVSAAHQRLGTAMTVVLASEELELLLASLDEGLALWRGLPLTELEDAPAAQAERSRLEELRGIALEDRAVAALGLGQHAMVAGELEVLTTTYPLRERLWGLRALALTRSGRQADALEVLRQVRELLADELGLEPGAELRALHTAVLRQDPALDWTASSLPQQRRSETRPRRDAAWPLVGRDDQLSALVGLFEQSAAHPVFAVVTGDPGIGKSRLCAELAVTAQTEGASVVVGRCSQDDGAPPLYAWASVLRELGHELPSGEREGDAGARQFRAWESIVRTVLEAARDRHLVVVLEDLHWADTSTLRVLRLLAETAETGRLMLLATWRHQPPPTGQLAETAEMLARRHALRLQLDGLSTAEAGEIVTAVAATTPTATEADALRTRTDGNPFFLVEYARLARERGDLSGLLEEEHPPAAVQDVLARRFGGLPEETVDALLLACVIGRYFDVPTLAAALDVTEDDVLDRLDPALRAGMVGESGVDRFRFAHALVRDTAYASLSRSRRARMHARLAGVLADRRDRRSEVARHWLAAGPQHAAQAWHAAVVAAREARHVYAYGDAARLLTAALEAIAEDPDAGAAERHQVLVELAQAHQGEGDWVRLREVVHQAIDAAEASYDVEGALNAISQLNTHALWQSGIYGTVDAKVVATLRAGLDRLPDGDSVTRCRAMLSLASEIYYTSTRREREALCEEAVAMARRLGDPAILRWSLVGQSLAVWRPGTARRRLEGNGEAARLAEELGDRLGMSTALTLQASAASELGLIEEMTTIQTQARQVATAERHLYALLVLAGLEVPWAAMRGDHERVDVLLAEMASIHERTSVPQSGDALMGAMLMKILWGGQPDELRLVFEQIEQVTVMPTETSVAALLCRTGQVDRARSYLQDRTLDLTQSWWFSPMVAALAAESALCTGLRGLAADAYVALSDYRGQPACAGSGTSLGPVDAYLAMAAKATGQQDLAVQHADEAARLCEEWRIPLASRWLAGVREQHGF